MFLQGEHVYTPLVLRAPVVTFLTQTLDLGMQKFAPVPRVLPMSLALVSFCTGTHGNPMGGVGGTLI